MTTFRRAALAASVSALLLSAAACSSDEDAGDVGDRAEDTTTAPDGDTEGTDATDGAGNPCEVVTQEQWEAIFGDGVTKADGSGGTDNCNVLTSGTSPGHEISLTNLASSGTTSFDDAVASYAGCSGAATDVDIADRAVLDTSCLSVSGAAWVVAQDGDDVLLVSLDLGGPAEGDVDAIGETFTTVATEVVAAR